MIIEDLKLIAPIQKALKSEGYTKPTPIQEMAIPHLLEGKDLLGCAQTGTGKTAAFAIPILQQLSYKKYNDGEKRPIKALILAPTRELSIQIGESFNAYGANLDLSTLVIFGGVSQHPQTRALTRGVDILVATPGRLIDLIKQKFVSLKEVEYFVLDEADMMLDMGMIADVRKIIKYLPKEKRQTMFFSATMPDEIEKLSRTILTNPVRVEVTPVASTVDIIKQEVYLVDKSNKIKLLTTLLKDKNIESVLVFSRTKHGANQIVEVLQKNGLQSQAIHGNKSQNARQQALNSFKEGKFRILVATDIAARGLDIDGLSHVINYDLPEVPETYVHRIGRTGRAGHGGIAISFCDIDEKPLFASIEKLIAKSIPENLNNPYPMLNFFKTEKKKKGSFDSNRGSKPSSGKSGKKPEKNEKSEKVGKIMRSKLGKEYGGTKKSGKPNSPKPGNKSNSSSKPSQSKQGNKSNYKGNK